MNIPYDEMPEKIEELMTEVEKLQLENKHLLDLQKSMDKQYEELEKENIQLKEQLKLVEKHTEFSMPDNMKYVLLCKADYERNKYEYETLDKYKSVLDEIREYINNNVAVYAFNNPDLPHWDFNDDDIKHILQILDKVKE